MNHTLPQRRLLVRAGDVLAALDLAQVREVRGQGGERVCLLAQVLGLPLVGPGVALLVVETAGAPVEVLVDAVGGVVEVAPHNVLPLVGLTTLGHPALLKGVVRVPEPEFWRGASLLPTPAAQLLMPGLAARQCLALDLDPVQLGARLVAFTAGSGA